MEGLTLAYDRFDVGLHVGFVQFCRDRLGLVDRRQKGPDDNWMIKRTDRGELTYFWI